MNSRSRNLLLTGLAFITATPAASAADTRTVPAVANAVTCAADSAPTLLIVEGLNQKPEQFKAYTNALLAAKIYEQLEGYYVTLGDPATTLEGSWEEQKFMVVARFPCKARAEQFWYSDTYVEIKKIRQGAGEVRALLFEEFPAPKRINWAK